jgi:ABC-type uncharacterized transport system fused permease/ATPase subunit
MNEPITPADRIAAKENFRNTVRQFRSITRAFFKSERRGKARGWLALLLALSVA